ncbi:MAG: hypothetical protein OQK11_06990 [Thiovulaceae bacterium]|nr:hypothetical protein [Sulfurimonadaceae bacterium]
MKTILISLFFLSSLTMANNDLSWVDAQVEAIKPPRDGESNRNISKIKNPFIFLKKNSLNKSTDKKVSSKSNRRTIYQNTRTKTITNSTSKVKKASVYIKGSLVLSAIINNSALISGKWYKLGDIINNYKITDIGRKTVTMKNKSRTKLLSTASKNKKLKFK